MEHFKTKSLDGRKFRRQHSIFNYIVDFCCPSEKLILELDGDLENLGFAVLRFENRFVFQDPDYLNNEIWKVFNKKEIDLKSQSTTPAARNHFNTLIICVLRPPLLQKEGKVKTSFLINIQAFP